MDKELESKIRFNFVQALNEFDFVTVSTVMKSLDWHWWGDNHHPSRERMIKTVEELFDNAIKEFKNSEISVGSGGFLVKIYKTGKVRIQFIAEESESFEYEK